MKKKKAQPELGFEAIRKMDGMNELESYDFGAIKSNAVLYEDDFAAFYNTDLNGKTVIIVEPPYNLVQLERICLENNSLAPCIDAMKTNIDGTGFTVEPREDEDEDKYDKDIEVVTAFFNEPYPGESFQTMRRKLREDLERTGNAYLEVLRNLKGEMVFLRHIEAKTVRMVKLDGAVPKKVKVNRNGTDQEVDLYVRERRFVQRVATEFIYFKEFGSQRQLNKNTGLWDDDPNAQGRPIAPQDRATEIIHFGVVKDVATPYYLPRWISQLPSVLGSRQAEEFNLSYFDSGGVPPILLIIQGGTMAKEAKKQLERYLSDKKAKHKAAILEAHSSSGSMDSTGQVRVTVERFGSERQQDSMFENYDTNCEKRTRRAFRLPPLFVGQADDYSFATAYASYVVAEAQVFGPERAEFDEVINLKILPELVKDPKKIQFRSLPLTVKDVTQQLAAIGIVSGKNAIDNEQLVKAINEITDLELTPAELDPETHDQFGNAIQPDPVETAVGIAEGTAKFNPKPQPAKAPAKKKSEMDGIAAMAEEAAWYIGGQHKGKNFVKLMQSVGSLSKPELKVFKTLLAQEIYGLEMADPVNSPEFALKALEVLAAKEQISGAA